MSGASDPPAPLGSLLIPPDLGRSVPIFLLQNGPGDTCRRGPTPSISGIGGWGRCQSKCSHTCCLAPHLGPARAAMRSHPRATFLWAQLGSSLAQSSGFTSPSSVGTSACRPFTPGPWAPSQWAEAGSPGRPEKLGESDLVSTHQERKGPCMPTVYPSHSPGGIIRTQRGKLTYLEPHSTHQRQS